MAAIYSLLCHGYYLEAYQLTRHASESLVQVAYFSSRKGQADAHLTPRWPENPTCKVTGLPALPRRRNATKFKEMFDAISPGYYQQLYPIVSDAAHGGLTVNMFRSELRLGSALKAGLFFESKAAMVVLTQFQVMTLGFLRWFPRAFPTSASSASLVTAQAEERLCELVQAQWTETPGAQPILSAAAGPMLWSPHGAAG